MTENKDMARQIAAERIVAIQGSLANANLNADDRENLNAEQRSLWDEHFCGEAYERIAWVAEWQHKIARYS